MIVKDSTSRLRNVRTRAAKINATIIADLKPFRATKLFRRLPDSNEKGNATTTCSCLMAMAVSNSPLSVFQSVLNESDENVRSKVTEMFEGIVNGTWTSSGLLDGNAFSSLLILRTAGILSRSREQFLTRSALGMTHTFKPEDKQEKVAAPFKTGVTKTLREILLSFAKNAPTTFSVEDYPSTSALAYWFVEATEYLNVKIPLDKWGKIVSWSAKNFARQVSLDTAHHDAMKDPIEMAMAACLCLRLKRLISNQNLELTEEVQQMLPTSIELEEAVLKAFSSQQQSGIWPKYFPLFNYREGGGGAGSNYLFSFELLEVLLEEFGDFNLLEHPKVLDGIEKALNWCESNRLAYKCKGTNYFGWNSGGQVLTLSQGKPESWATAMVHMFLFRLRVALSRRIDHRVLLKYGSGRENITKNSKPWDSFIDSPVDLKGQSIGVKELIERHLLNQIETKEGIALDDKIIGRRSALLFGPPGTSKTSLVRNAAKKIGWPLVELNPSHFLKKGLENIYSQAEEIFEDLNDLSRAVVFFDEMDALAQRRDVEQLDITRQLLTTSMLPKLSKLHDEGRVIFFMATNHQMSFDPAIKRPRRFDLLICMAPPEWVAKLENLRKFLPDGTKDNEIDATEARLKELVGLDTGLIEELNLFTFDDFKSFLEYAAQQGPLGTVLANMTETEFAHSIREWGATHITLTDQKAEAFESLSPREEFAKDYKHSRLQ